MKYCESILIGSLPEVDPFHLSIWTELFSYAHHEIHERDERDAKSAEHFKALPVGFLCVLCTEQVQRDAERLWRHSDGDRRNESETGIVSYGAFSVVSVVSVAKGFSIRNPQRMLT